MIKLKKIEKVIIDSKVPEDSRIKGMVDTYLGKNFYYLGILVSRLSIC